MAAENNIVGEVGLKVTPVDPGFDARLKTIINRLERDAAFGINANTTQAEQAVASLGNSIDTRIGGAWANAALQVGAFTAAVAVAQNTVNRLLGSFSGLFDQLAQAQAGFTSIIGTEAGGNALLDDIREFARVSPFVTEELVNYSQQLLGVGKSAETIVPLLEDVGNIVASVGGDTSNLGRVLFTLTQIQTIGRLTGQDAMQLQSALIPITKQLAAYLGITTQEVKKLQEQGKITSEQVFAALSQAGDQVEGAMANATRNISGARAVLSDTIKIALQDSPELQRIFKDIVNGILALSNALGDEEVQNTISRFFEGVGRIYDALQPIISQLSETGGESALVGLRALTIALDALAAVLDTIPTPVLEVISGALAVQAAIRTPLALIRYTTQLQTLASGLLGRYTGQTNQAATAQGQLAFQMERTGNAATRMVAAIQTSTSSMSALRTSIGATVNKYSQLIGAATAFAGIQLQQQQNSAAQVGGSILTGAGTGFALTGNPYGAAAGAAIGAVVGVLNQSAKKAEEEAKRLKEHAVEVAEAYFLEFNREFDSLSDRGAADELVGEVARIDALLTNYSSVIADYRNEREALRDQLADLGGITTPQEQEQADSLQARIIGLNNFIDGAESTRKRLQVEFDTFVADPRFADWATSLQTSLATLSKNGVDVLLRSMGEAGRDPFFTALITGERGLDPTQIESDFAVLNTALANAGINLNDLINLPYDDLVNVLTNPIPDAARQATVALDAFNAAVKRAQELTNLNFGPLVDQMEAVQSGLEAARGVDEAFNALFQFDEAGAVTGINSSLQAISAAGQAIVENAQTQYNNILQSALASGVPEADATARALEVSNNILSGQFDALRQVFEGTDAEFRNLLETAGLWDLYIKGAAGSDSAAENFKEYAAQLGISEERLAEIVRLQGDIDEQTQITVTADVSAAITALEQVNALLADPTLDLASAIDLVALQQSLQEQIDRGTTTIQPGSAGGLTPEQQLQLEQDAADRIEAALFEIGRSSSEDYIAYLRERMSQEQELSEEWLELRRQVVGIEEDIANAQRQAEEEAERVAEEAQREADRIAREQEQELNAWLRSVESATGSLESAIQGAADTIAAAAANWVSSIKERTQYEQAVSAQAATRNAQRQIADLTEVTSGLASLRARGVSDGVLQALGIDGITDVRQIRRLVGSSDSDLAALTAAVGERDRLAQSLAQSQEDARQRKNITDAIIDAAKTLGVDVNREQATAISNQFTITGSTNAEDIALQILNILTAGRISR